MNSNKYKNIRQYVKKKNSVVVNSISISGEGHNGLHSIIAVLSFLRLNIVNDTYHPHLFHYMVGASIGSVLCGLILNTRFLYETQSKRLALTYLDANFALLDFDYVKHILLNVNGDTDLGILTNPFLIFRNLYETGAVCVRDALVEFLEGNYPKLEFDNTAQYFTSKEYYNWLSSNNNLNNLFLLCSYKENSKYVAYTGNQNRFLNSNKCIDYLQLKPKDLIQAILTSSAIALLYPSKSIGKNSDILIDGSSDVISPDFLLHSLIHCSHNVSSCRIYAQTLSFFDIKPDFNTNFTIIHNKLHIQYDYEDIETYNRYNILGSPLLRQLNLTGESRPLNALFLQQPFVAKFSIIDANTVALSEYERLKQLVLDNLHTLSDVTVDSRVPLYLRSKRSFAFKPNCLMSHFNTYSEYKKNYIKHNTMTSNQVISTYLNAAPVYETVQLLDNNYVERVDEKNNAIMLTLNVCVFDMFVRPMYDYDETGLLFELLKQRSDVASRIFSDVMQLGIVSGNSIFDITTRQQTMTHDVNLIKCKRLKSHMSSLPVVIANARKRFLGE
jgi:hypothetical protein